MGLQAMATNKGVCGVLTARTHLFQTAWSLPALFERLVLSYRWAEVDLRSYRLLANPPGRGLEALLEGMSSDRILWKYLLEAGYIRFGMGADIDYDPICFDVNSRKKNRDCRIVKIDHEEILAMTV
jgi:hypothetical protein